MEEQNAELLERFGGGMDRQIFKKRKVSTEYIWKQTKLLEMVSGFWFFLFLLFCRLHSIFLVSQSSFQEQFAAIGGSTS